MTEPAIRLDKWLFQARLFKTRGLAAARIEGGGVRLNGRPCRKAGHVLRIGDQLTLPAHGRVMELRVLALGDRRGPASEARLLYQDLAAPADDTGADGDLADRG